MPIFGYPNRRVIYTTPVYNTYRYPVTNTCEQQANVLKNALVAKIQSISTWTPRAVLNELKNDANAIANQQASCNAFVNPVVIGSPFVTRYGY